MPSITDISEMKVDMNDVIDSKIWANTNLRKLYLNGPLR